MDLNEPAQSCPSHNIFFATQDAGTPDALRALITPEIDELAFSVPVLRDDVCARLCEELKHLNEQVDIAQVPLWFFLNCIVLYFFLFFFIYLLRVTYVQYYFLLTCFIILF